MNLHKIVDNSISSIQAKEPVTVRYSLGQVNNKGSITPLYSAPQSVTGRWQSESDEKLYHAEKVNDNDIIRRVYLYATPNIYASGINRPLGRSGDVILRKRDNTWWLITGLIEDFSLQGWVSVRVTLQAQEPDLSASPEPLVGEGL